jgi:Zn-dependent M16 (insulinase) family peptidase
MKNILFPSEDEETGLVCVLWQGIPWKDFDTAAALNILWKYLTDSAVSVFHQVFIEIEEPYCSDIEVQVEHYSTVIRVSSFTLEIYELIVLYRVYYLTESPPLKLKILRIFYSRH